MPALTLYDFALDENCYRVRLLLGLLALPCRIEPVDVLPGGAQRSPPMLALNPRGELPILCDGDLVLTGTGAILAYLARAHDRSGTWMPLEPAAFGRVQMWLDFAATALRPAHDARLASFFGKAEEAALRSQAHAALRIMDDAITRLNFMGDSFFAGPHPTIADIALFPAFALSRDIGIEHSPFAGLRRWYRHIRALPGFITMPGIPAFA